MTGERLVQLTVDATDDELREAIVTAGGTEPLLGALFEAGRAAQDAGQPEKVRAIVKLVDRVMAMRNLG